MFGNWQVHVAFEVWGILFCLMAGVIAYIASEKTNGKRMWLTGLFLTQILELAFDSLAWIFSGNTTAAGYYMVRISNAGVYIFNYMLIVVSTGYLCASVKKKSEQWAGLWMASAVAGAGIALTVITQFYPLLYRFDETNHCMRCDWFFLAHAIALLGVVLELALLTKYRTSFEKNKLIVLYIYLLMPMIALIWQLFFYGISLLQIMNTISLMCLFMVDAFRQTQKLVAKERELNDMKIQVVLSQIKPHFMYNVLNTITYLCDKDASVAKKALYDFSMYLRGNLDSLTSRATLQSSVRVDWAAKTAAAPSAGTAYTLQFLCTLLPTLLIEGALLLLYGYRSRRSWLVFLLVNLVTQGAFAAYLAATVLSHGASRWSLLFYFPAEVVITVVESLLYRRLLTEKGKGRATGYAIVANVHSATVGLLLIDPLWRFIVSIS